jgi:hypothetical protein
LRIIGRVASKSSCSRSVKSVRVLKPPPVANMHRVSLSHRGSQLMLSREIVQELTASM